MLKEWDSGKITDHLDLYQAPLRFLLVGDWA
jgi:hypothetical protein